MTTTKKIPEGAGKPTAAKPYEMTTADRERLAQFHLVEGAASWLRVRRLIHSTQGA
jgi:hypothetical protein